MRAQGAIRAVLSLVFRSPLPYFDDTLQQAGERPVGLAVIFAGERSAATMVVFASPGEMTLLGAHGLEGLNLPSIWYADN